MRELHSRIMIHSCLRQPILTTDGSFDDSSSLIPKDTTNPPTDFDSVQQLRAGDHWSANLNLDNSSRSVDNDDYDPEFEQLVASFMHDRDYIGVNQTALNLAYTIVNASLVSIPFTACSAGLPLFIAVMISISVASSYTAVMVVQMANEKRVKTLEDLAEVCGGSKLFLVVCVFQIMSSFAMMCITLLVWADVTSDVFRRHRVDSYLLSHRNGQIVSGAVLILPLCLFTKSMLSLKYSAMLTVFSFLFCVVIVTVTYYSDSTHAFGSRLETIARPKHLWWATCSFAIFYYSYNQRALSVYRCLKRRNAVRWRSAVVKANAAVTAVYVLFGVVGYLSLFRSGADIDDFNYFLNNPGEDRAVYDVAKLVMSASLLLTIPVDCLVARCTCRKLYRRYMRMVAPNEKQSSFNSRLVVDGGDRGEEGSDLIDEIDDGQVPAVTIFDSVDGACAVEGRDGWKSYPEGDYIHPVQSADGVSQVAASSQSFLFYLSKTDTRPVQEATAAPGDSSMRSSTASGVRFTVDSDSAVDARVMQLRLPSKDEIQSILDANSAPRSSQGKLISIDEQDYSSRMDTSWVSVMSNDTSAAAVRLGSTAANTSSPSAPSSTVQPSRSAAIALWFLCIATCFGVQQWMYLAASVGTFSTALLLFLLPTMLYFRMTLPTDYQKSPIIFGVLPNQLYMTVIQALGIILLLYNVFGVIIFSSLHMHIIQANSN